MWWCAHYHDVSHGETTWAYEACHQKGIMKKGYIVDIVEE